MSEKNCGELLILEQDRPVGILLERDYARKVVLKMKGKPSKRTPVQEIVSLEVHSILLREIRKLISI